MTIATILNTMLNAGVAVPKPLNKNFEYVLLIFNDISVLLIFNDIDDDQYTINNCFSNRIVFTHLPTNNEFMLRKEGIQDADGQVSQEFVSLYFRAESKDILVLNLVGYGKQTNELLNNEFDKLYCKHIVETAL